MGIISRRNIPDTSFRCELGSQFVASVALSVLQFRSGAARYTGSGLFQCGARGICGGQSNTEGRGSFQAFRFSPDIYYSTNAPY